MSQELKPPQPRSVQTDNTLGSWIAIVLMALICIAIYVVLTFLTLGVFGPVLIVGGILFGIVAFHYFVWGWWLGRVIREASDEEEEEFGSPI